MRALVSGCSLTMMRLARGGPYLREHLGHLLRPGQGNSALPEQTGLPFAMDNGAFTKFDEAAYFSKLERMARHDRTKTECLWVTLPDVVGDCRETLDLFDSYRTDVAAFKLPLSFVAQDGCEASVRSIPWNEIRCLFIGGTTEWKEAATGGRAMCLEAIRRGKLVHVGRVNSHRRLKLFARLGAHSFDGTSLSWFGDTYIQRFADLCRDLDRQEDFAW